MLIWMHLQKALISSSNEKKLLQMNIKKWFKKAKRFIIVLRVQKKFFFFSIYKTVTYFTDFYHVHFHITCAFRKQSRKRDSDW